MSNKPLKNGCDAKSSKQLPNPLEIERDKPLHKIQDSPLTNSSGLTNYGGFVNLGLILLIISNSRVALENIMKYGVLVDPMMLVNQVIQNPKGLPCTQILVSIPVTAIFLLHVTRAMAMKRLSYSVGYFIQVLTLLAMVVMPAVIVWLKHPFPLVSIITMLIVIIGVMKMISYVAVNGWCYREKFLNETTPQSSRRPSLSRSKSYHFASSKCSESVSNGMASKTHNTSTEDLDKLRQQLPQPAVVNYPDNLTYSDLFYYLVAPTLCYELNFPRTTRIRKRFVILRLVEMVLMTNLLLALVQQWMLPLAINSIGPFSEMDSLRMLERAMKMMVPNFLIWLIGFYTLFHSTMNFTAELLRFGDRQFYSDWWNSESIQGFWKSWNVPVHRFCLRHIYKPLRRRGKSPFKAALVVFVVSAIFHEYAVSIPLRMFRLWAALGMVAQIPLAIINERLLYGPPGNFLVWGSLIAGQPVAILMYFHDYYVLNHSKADGFTPNVANFTTSN